MQLTLNFPEIDDKKMSPDDHAEDYRKKEFEQGDFSYAMMQTRYSAKELLVILLESERSPDELKTSYLKWLGKRIHDIARYMDREYKDCVRKHNDEVRHVLRQVFEQENPSYLEHSGLKTFRRYNNAYRELFGGKHFNGISVENKNHEWHKKYLIKRKEHIKECISMLKKAKIIDEYSLVKYYVRFFHDEEFREAMRESDLSESDKDFILRLIPQTYTVIQKK